MPKRKKSSSGSGASTTGTRSGRSESAGGDNPLSDARRQAHGRLASKSDLNALNLWHRKSGAGYALFVSYYGSQPMGVVADADETGRSASPSGACAGDSGAGQKRGKGMSRAAKRRAKKRKRGTSISGTSAGIESRDQSPECCQNDTANTGTLPVDSSHPLIQAFSAQSKRYPHLAPYIHALSRPLPLTFRLRNDDACAASCVNRGRVAKLLATDYSDLVGPVPYDPTQAIYQSTSASNLSKANLSRLSPSLKGLLVSGSSDSTLARQELGSMLPVLSLSAVGALVPGAKVLDLCASPGSKTMQALEIAALAEAASRKRGRVVANDVHTSRLDSLRDAVVRSGLDGAFTSRITYTNFDASVFPSPNSGKLFDAIIADVPCSGDGTIRKDRHILPMWTPATGNALHGLQARILVRALELVKVGGVVCYSTCSLNPVEDEAVVAAALQKVNRSRKEEKSDDTPVAELVNWPEALLPGFKRRPGVENWRVAFYEQGGSYDESDEDEGDGMNTNGDFGNLQYHRTYEDAMMAGIDCNNVERSLWPDFVENKSSLCLKRCSRLWPQDQDTGGFFVSLIRKNR